jgi:hypothetical protein
MVRSSGVVAGTGASVVRIGVLIGLLYEPLSLC